MPPQTPGLDLSVVQQQPLSGARFSTDAPLEAFGGGASLDKVDRAQQNLGSVVEDIASTEKAKADQTAVLSASSAAMKLQSDLQVRASKMLGKDALGAPDMVQKGWQDGVSNITEGLANDQQKQLFAHYANSAYGELYKSTNLHVAGQTEKLADETTDAVNQQAHNLAVLNSYDDGAVRDNLDKQRANMEIYAQRKGLSTTDDVFKQKLQTVQSNTLASVIESRLTAGQDDAAQELFKNSKDSMTASDVVATEKRLETSKNLATSMQAWDDLKGLKLANGDPDEAKMQASIMSRDDLSNEQKLKVLDFVQSQAKIASYERKEHDAAQERGLLNAALQARKSGQPLDQALKLVSNYQWDNESQAVMQRQVQNIYAPPDPTRADVVRTSDNATNLYFGVHDGTVDKSAINQAFLKGDIDQSGYNQLTAKLRTKQAQGISVDERNTWDKVKTLAETTYPKDSVAQKNFLNTIRTVSDGKTPDQIWEIAQNETKDDPNTKSGSLWWTSYQPQWKGDMARDNANSLAMGKLQNDLGKDVVSAIGRGALVTKSSAAGPGMPEAKWGAGDVDQFAQMFGGYDKVKAGTPVNTAVRSLIKRGVPATPANVQALLNKYPDGVY